MGDRKSERVDDATVDGSRQGTAVGLLVALVQASERARAAGALEPISTDLHLVNDGPLLLPVRVMRALEAKATEREERPADFDPFLPFDPVFFVADLGPDHVALLNKYPVLERHLLVITRHFESQDDPLTLGDMEALGRGLAATRGVGFYNGGAAAGASQRHKHLQIAPLPLARGVVGVPIEHALDIPEAGAALREEPFRHAIAPLEGLGGAELLSTWRELMALLGLDPESPAPYNLLVTRRYMLVVARAKEHHKGISVNALGFAGAFFVKRAEDLETLKADGPLAVLRSLVL